MAEKLIIELLEEKRETVFDEDIDPGDMNAAENVSVTRMFRWGFVDELTDWPAGAETGTEDDLLLSLSNQAQTAVLLIPGDKVVTTAVPYNKKEARHFVKLLPYQVEEDVIGSVDDLHFAVSRNKDTNIVPIAYTDSTWLFSLLEWAQHHNIVVETCIANYQALHAVDNELFIWFTDGQVLGHRANGLGFSIAQSFSQAFIKDLLQNQQDMENPWDIKVYVADAEAKEIVESHMMPPLEYQIIIGRPPMSFTQGNQLNFCTGQFGKKLPIDQWWKEAKSIAILAAAAVVVFFVASFADIYLMKKQQDGYQEDMLAAFREVVPRGAATDPIRRLKSLLGSGPVSEEPSEVVYLLSKVAPVLNELKISLNTLNYSNREQALNINVRAEAFNDVEALRQKLEQQGVNAKLQSSNATKEGFQARLRIELTGA